MTEAFNVSQGELVLRTLAMPADTNANGDIFGGWLMSQMDLGGAILAQEIAGGRVVTVHVNSINFCGLFLSVMSFVVMPVVLNREGHPSASILKYGLKKLILRLSASVIK